MLERLSEFRDIISDADEDLGYIGRARLYLASLFLVGALWLQPYSPEQLKDRAVSLATEEFMGDAMGSMLQSGGDILPGQAEPMRPEDVLNDGFDVKEDGDVLDDSPMADRHDLDTDEDEV